MRDDVERAMRAGFADYWTKPLDFRTFTASIDALFGTAPARVAAQS
jgi:DNA-binding response OmpR family regulator